VEVVAQIGHSGSVYSVAFSPDGHTVLSGSGDNTLKAWNTATGALLRIFEGHSDYVWSVAFSPDGTRVLSGSSDKTLKLWDVATGQLVRTFELPPRS
jgi:WD40 repeat protein